MIKQIDAALSRKEIATETAHRRARPQIEWNYIVRLPNGEFGRVNVFDYNLTTAAQSNKYIQLASTAWIQVQRLTVIPHKFARTTAA